uniref:Uncharacterized protein n=1 Tax=Medicago truncatula TaxID=3880 RepID=A2Q2W8_MEDTR|nr:hypothetical protein MtrDRAFT_AC152185g22v2 [Medicago truncatula]
MAFNKYRPQNEDRDVVKKQGVLSLEIHDALIASKKLDMMRKCVLITIEGHLVG